MDLDKIEEEVKKRLSENRFNHSVGTMKAAKELAEIYGEDENEAALAGLMHDIAKEMSIDDVKDYIIEHNIEVDEIEKNQFKLLHAKIGASIAREEFKASEKVAQAIMYHTTGNVKMNKFDKIISLADKIEENRNYEQVEFLRSLAKENLDEAILFMLDRTIKRAVEKGATIHPNTIKLRNYLLINTF